MSSQTITAAYTSASLDQITTPGGPERGAQYPIYFYPGGTVACMTNIGTIAATVTVTWQECANTAFTGPSIKVVDTNIEITIGPTATIVSVGPFMLAGKPQEEYSQFIVACANGSGATISLNGLNVQRTTGGMHRP